MDKFTEAKSQLDALYGGNLEFSPAAFHAFATPRTPSVLERAFTTNIRKTALVATAVSYAALAGRINIH